MNNRKIMLSFKADRQLSELLEYLENSWSDKVKDKFLNTLSKRLNIIKTNPEAFPKSNIKTGLHKCVISKQTSVYYSFDEAFVYVLTILDNRFDPQRLKDFV